MKKIDIAIIGIRLFALFLVFKHLDIFIETLTMSNFLISQDTMYDKAFILYVILTKLIYLGLLVLTIFYAPKLAVRIVSNHEKGQENIDLPKFDFLMMGLFIVAGYSFLDGVSDVVVESYSYMQDKLSGNYERIHLFNSKILLRAFLKSVLSFMLVYFHKSIYKYLESMDRS